MEDGRWLDSSLQNAFSNPAGSAPCIGCVHFELSNFNLKSRSESEILIGNVEMFDIYSSYE